MVNEAAARKHNPGFESRPKCSGIRKDGDRCGSFALDDGFCYRHSPHVPDEHKKRAWRLGGKTPNGYTAKMRMLPPRLQLLYDDLEQAWLSVATGDMAPTRGTALATLANAMRGVMQSGEMEQRIRDLEQVAPDEGGDEIVED